jgi:hypothetical protein
MQDHPGAKNNDGETTPDNVEGAAHVRASDNAGVIVWKGANGVEYLGHCGDCSDREEVGCISLLLFRGRNFTSAHRS